MAQLRQYQDEYTRRGVQVVVVGPDSQSAFKRFWEENGLAFPGLSDPRSKVAGQYAQEVNLLKLGRMPAQFLIDPEGIIRYAHYSNSMSDIPEEEHILKLFDTDLQRNHSGA